MEEKDNLTKAMTLMSSALKQYEEGKFDVAEHSRQEANKLFDEINGEMSTQDGIDRMRFGESRNFGMLYSIFESNSMELYKNGKEKLVEMVETIQTDPVLLSEFKIYNAFLHPKDVSDSESYVNEAVQLAERHTLDEIKASNIKFMSKMRELGLNENVCPSPEEIGLYEDIEYVITTKPDIANIVAYSDVKRRLSECVDERNVNKKKIGSDELRHSVDEAYDVLSSKYGSELTKDEIELVESMLGDEKTAESRFNEVKGDLLKRINEEVETANDTDKSRWDALKESIQTKAYDKKTALVDIAEMIEAFGIIEE